MKLDIQQIKAILAHLVQTYSKNMEKWGSDEHMAGYQDVASAYGHISFDLINLLHLIDGNMEQAEANLAAMGSTGSFSLQKIEVKDDQMADYQADEVADGDPLKWN